MTLTLAYDSQLSRVRLTGSAPGVLDTFTRSVVDAWGSANTGQAWTTSGGSASDYSVNGTQGLVSLGTVTTVRVTTISPTGATPDLDVTATVSSPVLASGDWINAALVGRFADASNHYRATLEFKHSPAGQLGVRLYKVVGGTTTGLGSGVIFGTYAANERFAIRFQIIGSTLRVKVWRAVDPEPTSWTDTITDTALTAVGAIGTRQFLGSANTNTLPVVLPWDDFKTLGTTVAERSTDLVRWVTVRGGQALAGNGGDTLALDDYEFTADVSNTYRWKVIEPSSGATVFTESSSITPALTKVWVKSIARPWLNREVTVADFSEVERAARAGVFDVVGRSFPIAVSDVRGSKRYTLEVLTETATAERDFDLLLASGDPIFLHVPAASMVPGGYFTIGDTTARRTGRTSRKRVFELELTEIAAPGPDVVGATITWQGVLSAYATWQAVLDAHATWNSLLELIGSPSDVVAP